jgi:hypothetical protein
MAMAPLIDVLFTPQVGMVAAATFSLLYGIYKTAPTVRRFVHFLDDWGGEPQRGPVPARPGVLERLHSIESDVSSIEIDVSQLKHDVAELREETAR